MFGLLGGGAPAGPSIVSFDSNLLTAYYNTRIQQTSLASSTSSAALSSNFASNDQDIVPPWDSSKDQLSFDDRLRKALAATNFVNLRDASLGGKDVSDDYKSLFALHKGMNLLLAIASHASDKTTSELRLPGLDRQFQEGMGQVFDYLATFKPDDFILAPGEQADKVDADLRIERPLSQFSTGILHTGAAADPLGGLTGTETFDIAVKKSSGTMNVHIDLSNVTGDLNLTNIADYINSQLEAAGSVTRLSRELIEVPLTVDDGETLAADRDPIKGYGLKIQGVSTEVLSFSSASATGAVYLSGVSGDADHQAGNFLKLTGIEGADPTREFGTRMTAEGEGTAEFAASAMDSQGNTYTVGTTTGDVGSLNIGTESDAILSKYDSAGHLLWQRALGAATSAEGYAIEVDASDNVIIAGNVTGQLTDTSRGGGLDSFVTKYDSSGEEVFTRQIAPLTDDGATSLAIAADGSIYVGGQTDSALAAGLTYAGGSDAYVTKLDAAGALVYNRQFGTGDDDRVTSLAVASDGELIVGIEQQSATGTQGIVRKYAEADGTSAALWEVDLGDLQAGSLNSIAVDGSNVYVVGSTDNGSLDAGGTATINGTLQGVQDGFLTRLTDSGASATADHTTYIGTGSTDRIYDVKVLNGEVYVAGDTLGEMAGETQKGSIDGFAAKFQSDGTLDWVNQYGGHSGYAAARGIEVHDTGSSVLDVLGMPVGQLDYTNSRTVTARTTVREGQYFSVSVDGSRPKKIEIEAGDTLREVARKIQSVLLLDGTARARRTSEGDTLRIEGGKGVRIELIPGEGELDALRGLGLEPGSVYNNGSLLDEEEEGEELTPFYGLGLVHDLSLGTREDAVRATEILQDAMSALRKAFNDLTRDPFLDELLKNGNAANGPVPSYLQNQLANYNAGLARLEAGGGSTTLGLF